MLMLTIGEVLVKGFSATSKASFLTNGAAAKLYKKQEKPSEAKDALDLIKQIS
ncbi:hypothetical protein NIES4071_06550 [Calothrix sp. NIES-4071]|nr:hypothetical protein NIES4071_06550 [Calothrix sp. NIES-4071]BAZ54997.1 hypothetical protein NIES4105_06510 [Calothrix sp. NIES-4105]